VSCHSENRCRSVRCDTRRWRYAGQIGGRILPDARRFFIIEIDIGEANFRAWASRVRNVVEYRRAQLRWWNEVSLTVWLCRGQRARGIVALGPIQEAELVEAFERWPTTLRPVASEDVRAEVYRALHPGQIAILAGGRRYQSISFSVGRRTSNAPTPKTEREPPSIPIEIVAMPCLFSE